MIKTAKIYIKNKLLKYSNGISQKGSFIHLFTAPKNFRQNLDEAEQAVANQKSKKKKILNLLFFILNLVIIGSILTYQIINSEDMSFSALFSSTFSPPLLLFMLFIWFLLMMVDTYRTNLLILRSSGKSRPFLSYKVDALGKYYDNITPMSTGGQPFQIFYLSSRGLSASAAISVPMGRYVASQIATMIIWTIALFCSFLVDLGDNFNFIRPLCVIGFILNSLLVVLVIFLAINQRLGKKLVAWVMKFLYKIKIIKNYDKHYNSVIKTVTDFQVTIKSFAKSKGVFSLVLGSSILYSLFNYSMPFLVYTVMIGYFDFSMMPTLVLLGILIEMASSFVPLPGGSGVSELSFTALFAVVFTNSAMLTWALLLWRFMNYYIYLIQGLFVLTYDKVMGERKYRWQKKKWELEAESLSFTQDKLQEFSANKNRDSSKLV